MKNIFYKSIEIEIEMDDIKDFIDNCSDTKVKEIIKYCKSDLQTESTGIPIISLQDEYKIRVLKEIWDDLSIEDVENMIYNYKSKNGK